MANRTQTWIQTQRGYEHEDNVHKRHTYRRDVQASTIERQIPPLSLYLIVVHHGVFLLNNTNDDTDKDIRACSSSSIIELWIRMCSYWMIRILIRSCSSSSSIRKQKWSCFYWMIQIRLQIWLCSSVSIIGMQIRYVPSLSSRKFNRILILILTAVIEEQH